MGVYRLSIAALMAVLCASCGSDRKYSGIGEAGEESQLANQAGVGEASGEGNTATQGPTERHAVRELDHSDEGVKVTDRSTYESLHRYGHTQKIFHFGHQNAVLQISIDNQSVSFETKATVYIFDLDIDNGKVEKWINNRVSDAIYADAPEPTFAYELEGDDYQVTSNSVIGHFTGEYGDEYQGYLVDIYVDNIAVDNVFYLNSFVTDAEVYVRTKDIDRELVP